MHSIRTYHRHPEGKMFAWMGLILYLGISFIYPVFPSFVKEIVKNDEYVSVFYSAMAIVTLFAALASTVVFRKVDRAKITKWGFLIAAVSFFFLIFISRVTELAVVRTIQVWANLFILMAISLYIRDFATSRNLGEEEGLFYTFNNIGVFVGPLLGGFIAARFGYEITFFIAAIIIFCGFGYFYHKHTIQKHSAFVSTPKINASKFMENIKDNFSNPGRVKSYFITLFLMIWFGFRTLYIPLYVLSQGYLESTSGLILSLGIIPYILLEIKVGKYAEKKGVRIPITLGFLFIGLILLTIFISPYPIFNFLLLIVANVGSAFIEPLQEYSLFRNLSKEDENRLYGVHMTANPIGYFISPTIGILILALLPFNYIFLIFGGIMILASGLFWIKLRHL